MTLPEQIIFGKISHTAPGNLHHDTLKKFTVNEPHYAMVQDYFNRNGHNSMFRILRGLVKTRKFTRKVTPF